MTCAVFVDFDNLFTQLKARPELAQQRTRDIALGLLENLKVRLQSGGVTMVLGRSYAAFDTYPGMEVAHDLSLMGFDPVYTLVSPDGRGAEVQIAVDVCRVLFRRPDIETIVIVSGDGNLIPMARQVLEEARGLRVVALPDAISGNLRLRVGADRFVSALDLLPDDPDLRDASAKAKRLDAGDTPALASTVAVPAPTAGRDDGGETAPARAGAAIVGHIPVTWSGKEAPVEPVLMQQLALTLDLIVRAQLRHGTAEIWLSPFLKGPMTQQFAKMLHPQRRALINELRHRGVIRVEVRENQFADHPYSVIVLQHEHPWVVAAIDRSRRA